MRSILAVIVAVLLAATAHADDNSIGFSASFRSAKVDTVFDWQVAATAASTSEHFRFMGEVQVERQDGVHYVDQEYFSAATFAGIEAGARYQRVEESGLYHFQVYGEKKFVHGIFGIGYTRAYREETFGRPVNMFRSSMRYSSPLFVQDGSFLSVSATIDGEYSRSDDVYLYRIRVASPVAVGHIYSISPMLQASGTNGGGVAASTWQAKVILEVHF